ATFDMTSRTPAHLATVPIQTSKLSFNFNQFVNANTGNLILGKVGGTAQSFDVLTNPNVEIQGATVNINGIMLEPNSTYYVTIPRGFVTSDYGANPSDAV